MDTGVTSLLLSTENYFISRSHRWGGRKVHWLSSSSAYFSVMNYPRLSHRQPPQHFSGTCWVDDDTHHLLFCFLYHRFVLHIRPRQRLVVTNKKCYTFTKHSIQSQTEVLQNIQTYMSPILLGNLFFPTSFILAWMNLNRSNIVWLQTFNGPFWPLRHFPHRPQKKTHRTSDSPYKGATFISTPRLELYSRLSPRI